MSTLKTTNVQHPSATDPAIELDAAGKLWLAGGKILQVVRATDSTARSTTSATFVDVTGMSVTITPQKATSSVLLIATFRFIVFGTPSYGEVQITDSSNVAISGAEAQGHGSSATNHRAPYSIFGYVAPGVATAVTYKCRFAVTGGAGTATMENNYNTGQLYAIEVSA